MLPDTLDVTDALSVTLSGRFNAAQIDLDDRNGTALSGQHSYNRFNPAAGPTYQILPGASAYAGYAESNRAPTPAELSCASAASPCTPDQLLRRRPVAEAGGGAHGRGRAPRQVQAFETARVEWNAGRVPHRQP